MKSRIRMLKVKIKTLACEAQMIREEERKSRKSERQRRELHEHRVHEVRDEQRCSLLAYAFLRGLPYSQVETRSRHQPNWTRVESLVKKFGTTIHHDLGKQQGKFTTWRLVAIDVFAAKIPPPAATD